MARELFKPEPRIFKADEKFQKEILARLAAKGKPKERKRAKTRRKSEG